MSRLRPEPRSVRTDLSIVSKPPGWSTHAFPLKSVALHTRAWITFHDPYFPFFPSPFPTPRIHSTLLRVFSSVPLHSRETTPSQPTLRRYSMQARMLSALTPPPT